MCFFWGYYFKTYLENIINISLSDYNTMKMSFRKLILLEMSFKCIFCNKIANEQYFSPTPYLYWVVGRATLEPAGRIQHPFTDSHHGVLPADGSITLFFFFFSWSVPMFEINITILWHRSINTGWKRKLLYFPYLCCFL